MGESTETLIQMLFGKMPYAEGLEYQPDVSKVLNSKKVSDHHAIIPTMEVAKADIGELKERSRKILYLISARVLTATADPYIYESHKCQITCNYHTFYLKAKKTKQEGFKAIENKLKQFFGVISEKRRTGVGYLGWQALRSLVILLYRSILHSHRNSTQKIPCFLRWNVQGMKN